MFYNLIVNKRLNKLTLTALMAALCYVAFSFLQIKIPTPVGFTSFHLGNVFCVLAALLLDGVSGGLAGAIGMGIGDVLDPVYITVAPKTILLKMLMGVSCGFFAHKVFKIDDLDEKKKNVYAIISIALAMLLNVFGETVLTYLYYSLILGNYDKALTYLTGARFIMILVNSILTTIVTSVLYIAIKSRLGFLKNSK